MMPAMMPAIRWLPTRKRGTVLFLLPVKELNMACMRETHYLRSCMVISSSFFV